MAKDVTQTLSKYFGKGFNEEQLEEIKVGLEQDLDISLYARVEMPASEMNHVRKSLYAKKHPEENVISFEEKYNQEKQEEYLRQKIKSQQELGVIALIIALLIFVVFIIFSIKVLM